MFIWNSPWILGSNTDLQFVILQRTVQQTLIFWRSKTSTKLLYNLFQLVFVRSTSDCGEETTHSLWTNIPLVAYSGNIAVTAGATLGKHKTTLGPIAMFSPGGLLKARTLFFFIDAVAKTRQRKINESFLSLGTASILPTFTLFFSLSFFFSLVERLCSE